MSLDATLTLDARNFNKALREAEVHLQGFDRANKGLDKSLSRLGEGFSGQRITIEVSKMAEVVRRLGGEGGVAAGLLKLTDAELRQVTSSVERATLKFAKLGQELPEDVRAMQTAIAGMGQAAGGASGLMGTLTKSLGAFGPLLPVASIGGAAAALFRLGSSAIESASHITDLSNRLGVSVSFIQELQQVANQTGSTVETFTAAAFKLGVNVAKGSDDARDAVAKLGLAYQTLKSQTPEEQFRSVVQALEGVDNAQERNRLGMALFGKQFSEIAGAVAEGYTAIATQASQSSSQQIAALDRLGDRLTQLKDNFASDVRAIVANLALLAEGNLSLRALGSGIDDLTDQERNLIAFTKKSGGDVAAVIRQIAEAHAELNNIGPPMPADGVQVVTDYVAQLAQLRDRVRELTPDQIVQLTAATKLGVDAAETYADSIGLSQQALALWQAEARNATRATKELSVVTGELGNVLRFQLAGVLAPSLVDFQTHTTNADQAVRQLQDDLARLGGQAQEIGPVLANTMKTVGAGRSVVMAQFASTVQQVAPNVQSGFSKLFGSVFGGAQQFGSSVSSIFQSAFTGGGGAMGAVKAFATKGLSTLLGMIPGVGPFVSGFAGPIVSMFGKLGSLFGGQGKKVNDLRDAYTKAGGGIDALAARAQAAGLTLDRFLRARTVKEYEAAIRELDAAFGQLEANRNAAASLFDEILSLGSEGIPAAFQPAIDQLIALGLLTDAQADKLRALGAAKVNVDQMKRDIELFGGRIDALGPGFRQAQIDKTAGEYVNAIDRLIKGGADVGGVLFDARDEIGQLVSDALQFGTTLPANMQPWIEELVRSGNLVDKNGQKITDVSQLKFGDPIKTEAQVAEDGWKRILDAIQALIDRINGPLVNAIDGIPTNRTINVGVQYSDPGAPTGGGNPAGGYATGTMGVHGKFFRNFGSGTPTTLHGTEAVVTPDQAPSFAAAILKASLRPARAVGATTIRVPVYIDGRQVATATAPYLPGALRTYGV